MPCLVIFERGGIRRNMPWSIIDYRLPIVDCRLPITDYRLSYMDASSCYRKLEGLHVAFAGKPTPKEKLALATSGFWLAVASSSGHQLKRLFKIGFEQQHLFFIIGVKRERLHIPGHFLHVYGGALV